MSNQENNSDVLLKMINETTDIAVGITGSPSTTLEIYIDITEQSKAERVLGQMVYVKVYEDGREVLVIGQIIEIKTQNRWHEDPSFKGVIKRHGGLPHLSGTADNRIAKISVQACYDLGQSDPQSHILGTSPSTGEKVNKMNNQVMGALMLSKKDAITYIGKVYGTEVDLPFWFKHFDVTDEKNKEYGAKDAYHIGVFGKTGSGKTVTSAFMLMGYAKNKNNISILVLDPQGQFYIDKELLPNNESLKNQIEKIGMKYESYNILEDICLPGDRYDLFAELLASNGFIYAAMGPFYTPEKITAAQESIQGYMTGRSNHPGFNLSNMNESGRVALLKEMLTRFVTLSGKEKNFTSYVEDIYGTKDTRERLVRKINLVLENIDQNDIVMKKWNAVFDLFSEKKIDGSNKITVRDIAEKTVNENGNFIILDLSPNQGEIENENLQALFVKIIENRIVELGSKLYAKGEKANCLIVMDEAHRFIASDSNDERIKSLTKDIIGSVRTTRKYGIGYFFITQTIESLDDEILRQMRIFSFGYGLTSGQELRKVSEVVNNQAAIQLYKSFIDPSSNKRFPFMFFGPISPLSFTGSPLFLEVYKEISNFK